MTKFEETFGASVNYVKVVDTVVAGINVSVIRSTTWVRLNDICVSTKSYTKYYPGCHDDCIKIFRNRKEVEAYCKYDMKWYKGCIYIRLADLVKYIKDRADADDCPWEPKEAAAISLLTGLIVPVKMPKAKPLSAIKALFKNDLKHRQLFLVGKEVKVATRRLEKAIKAETEAAIKATEDRLNG